MISRAMGKANAVAQLYDHIGRQVAAQSGAWAKLFSRAVRLYRDHGFSVTELIENGLLDPALSDDELSYYASRQEQVDFITRNVPYSYYSLTADQSVALATCRMAGLPTPELVAVYGEPEGFAPGGPMIAGDAQWTSFLDGNLPEKFFVKPAIGMLGQGAAAYRREGAEIIAEEGGERLTIEGLQASLSQSAAKLARGYRHYGVYLGLTRPSGKILIQKRLFSHPEIVALSGSDSLSCLRVITYVDKNMKTRIIGTAMKLIAGKGVTDNYHKGQTGNIWASIDAASGRIGRAHGPVSATGSYERLSHHPATGRAFSEFRVPLWEEACELAIRAAHVFLPHPLIGWDIAVTPDGPVIIEGNSRWTILPAPLQVRLSELEES